MNHVLVISGHTDLATSVANKAILEALAEQRPNTEILKPDETYPGGDIDIRREQQRLVAADVIVLQYPLFWYSIPSLLQKYMEEVFRHGFSHGSNGRKLVGKKLVQSFTTGAPEEAFSLQAMGITLPELCLPLRTACRLTGMEWSGYVATCGVGYTNRTSPDLIEQQIVLCRRHAEKLCTLLDTLEPARQK